MITVNIDRVTKVYKRNPHKEYIFLIIRKLYPKIKKLFVICFLYHLAHPDR